MEVLTNRARYLDSSALFQGKVLRVEEASEPTAVVSKFIAHDFIVKCCSRTQGHDYISLNCSGGGISTTQEDTFISD